MESHFLTLSDGRQIAIRHRLGRGPTLLFLPGYASDMLGSKASALDHLAERHGLPLLRFDYSGTGESPGRFANGTLERWLEEAEAVAGLADGPLLIVGSSMGGWLMCHLAERLGDRLLGLVGIAAAPDFTDWGYGEEEKARLRAGEDVRRPNPYGGEAGLTTAAFWASGERLRVLERTIACPCPVRLLHGDRDEEVPIDIAFRLKDRLSSDDVQLVVVKEGTHRLSRPGDLRLLESTVLDLLGHGRGATS